MELPPFGASKFLILSTLMDGREKTPSEVISECDWTKARAYFTKRLTLLHNDGYVDRFDVRRKRDDSSTAVERVVRITPAGRRAWREVVDWYLFIAQSAEQAADSDSHHDEAVVARVKVEPNRSATAGRLPTSNEERKLLSTASPEFGTLYRFVRDTGAGLKQLTSLDVGDVDLSADWLDLPRGGVRGRPEWQRNGSHPKRFGIPGCDLTPLRRALLETAIGNRNAGPVFLSTTGKRWHPGSVYAAFSRLRRAAGLDPTVQLMGRSRRVQAWRNSPLPRSNIS